LRMRKGGQEKKNPTSFGRRKKKKKRMGGVSTVLVYIKKKELSFLLLLGANGLSKGGKCLGVRKKKKGKRACFEAQKKSVTPDVKERGKRKRD